jgi:hypothetical protein
VKTEAARPSEPSNILPHHYTASQPEDGGSIVLRNIGTIPHHYMVSQPEDGGNKVLRNVGTLPHLYTVSEAEDVDLKLHHHENLKCQDTAYVFSNVRSVSASN